MDDLCEFKAILVYKYEFHVTQDQIVKLGLVFKKEESRVPCMWKKSS